MYNRFQDNPKYDFMTIVGIIMFILGIAISIVTTFMSIRDLRDWKRARIQANFK